MTSSSRNESAKRIEDLAATIQQSANEQYYSDKFTVEGLEVTLNSVDPSLVRWVLKYLQPLSLGSSSEKRQACTFFCLYSDDLVTKATRHFMVEDNVQFTGLGKDRALLKCAEISDHLILYCNGSGGIFWLADFATKTIFMIFSSRTRMPALDFSRIVRDIVTAYLTDQGWALYHAGAVDTADGALMIVGNPGAGKTSLILALLREGARYIANEQLFVRIENDGVRMLGYPLVVAVGLGTALQFPELGDLVETPDPLLYPRRRYNARRIAETPREEWPSLEDKLQLLPDELGPYVGATGVLPGGPLHAVIVPEVSKTSTTPKAELLDQDETWEILSDNLLEPSINKSRRAWSAMVVEDHHDDHDDEQSIDVLSYFTAVRFKFSLSPLEDKAIYTDTLLAGIHAGNGSALP